MNAEELAQDRFRITEEKDLVTLAEETIPQSTKDKAMWAFRLYERWVHLRKRAYNPAADLFVVGDILMVHSKLDDMALEDLNNVMSQFISEIRKEIGEGYPGKTLHEWVSSLQKHFDIRGRKTNFFLQMPLLKS